MIRPHILLFLCLCIFNASAEYLADESSEPHVLSSRDVLSYKEYVAKGRKYWADLQSTLANPNSVDTATINLQTRWKLSQPMTSQITDESLKYCLKQMGIHSSTVFAKAKATLRTNEMIFFETLLAPQAGVLIATESYSGAYNLETKEPETAPDRWSSVIWSIWNLGCRSAKKDSASLKYIMSDMIVNEATNQTLFTAVSALNRLGNDARGNPLVTTWTPRDEQFYAAIGTPNAVGVVYLLKDYANSLGRTISKVSTVWNAKMQVFYMWFELADSDYC